MLGIFLYSASFEAAERKLFEACKKLRTDLGKEADSVYVEMMIVEYNLAHQHDLHGRRRAFVTLESYKVKLQNWKMS